MYLKQMKYDLFLIKILQGVKNVKYAFEIRFLLLASFRQESRGSANRSLQDLNIISNNNSNLQDLKGSNISIETISDKKIKNPIIKIVSQFAFLSKEDGAYLRYSFRKISGNISLNIFLISFWRRINMGSLRLRLIYFLIVGIMASAPPKPPSSHLLGKQSVTNNNGIQSEIALENKFPENVSYHDRPSILNQGNRFHSCAISIFKFVLKTKFSDKLEALNSSRSLDKNRDISEKFGQTTFAFEGDIRVIYLSI